MKRISFKLNIKYRIFDKNLVRIIKSNEECDLSNIEEFKAIRSLDLRKQCIPIKEAASKNPKLASKLKDGKIDLGDSQALSEYNKAVLQMKFGLKIHLPSGHLIPAVCLRSAFIQEAVKPRQNVLEIGTGSSAILAMIMATMGCNVVATEANKENMLFAEKNIERNSLEHFIKLRSCAPNEILSGVLRESEIFDRIIAYPPQYGREQLVRFHRLHRGFGGDHLELIGGNKGYEFAVQLIRELAESSVLGGKCGLALLILNKELVGKIIIEMRNMKLDYQVIEIFAGTRHRYIVKGAPTSEIT